MPAVLLLEKDPFVEALAVERGAPSSQNQNVRRPLYGISLKEPRWAFLSVKQASVEGNLVPISMHDSSAPGGFSNANHNFILQKVDMELREKVQIVETFGDNFTFFYGEKPVVLQVMGVLFNTSDFNWKNEWLYNYEHYLRGTKCVENNARVYLGFDDMLVEGYVLTTRVSWTEDQPYLCPFAFQMLLTNRLDLSEGDTRYVTQASEARARVSDQELVEYLSDVVKHERWDVNEVTGDAESVSDFSPDVPASISDAGTNVRTAFWTSDREPVGRQWKDESAALLSLNTKLAAESAGVDEVTSRQTLRASPGTFPLGARAQRVLDLKTALGEGIANSVVTVSDLPTIE